jgi:hypothetical protein
MEIATGVGGAQKVEIRKGKLPSEVFRVAFPENLWHIVKVGYHLLAKINISP